MRRRRDFSAVASIGWFGFVLAAIILLVYMGSCTSARTIETQTGKREIACVGISGNRKQPGIAYDLSVKNTVLAIFFSETVVVPVVVLAKETFCPVADTTHR
jgi:hypothetical protein